MNIVHRQLPLLGLIIGIWIIDRHAPADSASVGGEFVQESGHISTGQRIFRVLEKCAIFAKAGDVFSLGVRSVFGDGPCRHVLYDVQDGIVAARAAAAVDPLFALRGMAKEEEDGAAGDGEKLHGLFVWILCLVFRRWRKSCLSIGIMLDLCHRSEGGT